MHEYHYLLQVVDGYLQFRFNLGSGEAIARQTTIQVNDDKTHTVTIERKEQTVTLVIDDSYVARATSPGESNTLDIKNDRVYLAANVDNDGKANRGFSGCITGVKINHRDLPVSGSTKYYIASPSSGVETGCTFEPPNTGEAFPTVASIAAGATGLLIILVVLPISIFICIGGKYLYRKRKGSYMPRTSRTTMRSPTFNWQPVPQMTNTAESTRSVMSSQPSQPFTSDDSFVLQDLNQRNDESSQCSPPTAQHPFRTPEQSPERPTRRDHQRRLQHLEQRQQQQTEEEQQMRQHRQQSPLLHQTRVDAIAVQPPAVPKPQTQLSNDGPSTSASQPPPAPSHTRSPSGHQSIMTIMTSATEATSVFDDTEVGKYVLKRIEAANEDLKTLQKDEFIPFKEEGDFEPLGSVGSLYDIVREADENYGAVEHTITPASRPPVKPKPDLSSLPTHPSHSQAAAILSKSTKHTKLKHKNTDREYNQSQEQSNQAISGKKEQERGRAAIPSSDIQSTKHTTSKYSDRDINQPEHSHQGLPVDKKIPASDHSRSNGIPPQQEVENMSRPRGRRRGRRAGPPALAVGAGESLMDQFQKMSTSPSKSQEWNDGKLV